MPLSVICDLIGPGHRTALKSVAVYKERLDSIDPRSEHDRTSVEIALLRRFSAVDRIENSSHALALYIEFQAALVGAGRIAEDRVVDQVIVITALN